MRSASDEFQRLAKTPGFAFVFEQYLDQVVGSEGLALDNAVALLGGLVELDEPWIATAWRKLRRHFKDEVK